MCNKLKVIYQTKGVIYEVQGYSNSSAVVIDSERDDRDDFKFSKLKVVISAMETPCVYSKKLLTVDFSHHYN